MTSTAKELTVLVPDTPELFPLPLTGVFSSFRRNKYLLRVW